MKLRWRELIIAFLMALVLWYGVSGSEKLETQVEARIDYRGLPQGMTVLNGFVSRVSVRIRAPGAMLRSIGSRDFTLYMDLSTVQLGENILPVTVDSRAFPGGVEIMDVSPSRIYLNVDTLGDKTVPLAAHLAQELPPDYVAEVKFSPAEVRLSGPDSILSAMDQVEVTIGPPQPVAPGVTEHTRILHLPEGVGCEPAEVKLTLQLGLKRKLVKVTRSVQVDVPAAFGRFVRPDKVSIAVAMPESMAAKAAGNKEIRAFVTLPEEALGSYTLPVKVALPEGAEVVTVEPDSVTVTLEQKQPPKPEK
ncbi:hypothetical protein LJC59_08875 [Desulfovibrio sp. OttesenSCG-928-A18]|nr:hypothetical protein [Desulfovibrio sp. OttesenSCG-928-A18]